MSWVEFFSKSNGCLGMFIPDSRVSLYRLHHLVTGFTIMLQECKIHFIEANQNIDLCIEDTQQLGENVHKEYSVIYKQTVCMAEQLHVGPTIPRLFKKQIHPKNLPAQSIEEHHNGALIIPVLDTLLFLKLNLDSMNLTVNKPNC